MPIHSRPPSSPISRIAVWRAPLLLASLCVTAACVAEIDLGVAAFEIETDAAILWTRAEPVHPGRPVVLSLEVATDADFSHIVRRRHVVARKSEDYTVRAQVRRLHPGTRYWYRFRGHGADFAPLPSPVGSFRTARRADDAGPVRFVISGDSNLGFTSRQGLDFYVLSAAAAEDPDFFIYFGDTIYADSGILPGGADAETLDEYREVHRLTRADPHLQTLLAATGTFTGWDDHEVRNDYDGETVDPAQFRAGARAFFEYLPVRSFPPPKVAPYRTHRRMRWGRHAEFFFLDGRQFRSAEQFCNETLPDGPETSDTLFSPYPEDEEIAATILPPELLEAAAPLLTPSDPECVENLLGDPSRTYLGQSQLRWLKHALLDSDATFKIIINNTPISSVLSLPYDRWEGYVAERLELLDFIGQNLDSSRTLVLTTDFHTNLALRRPELTELIVGPIGQSTFGSGVISMLPPDLQPFGSIILLLLERLIAIANGADSSLGSQPDAFSYAVIDVSEDAGGAARLRATVRGDPTYAEGANDPSRVVDLFSFEMPN